MERINSNTYSVRGLLSDQNFYFIPDYQREYVWTEREVNQLMQDVYQEFDESDGTEYFIGTMVVCNGEGGKYEVIDGQQRLTTLYVMLNAFYHVLSDKGMQDDVQQILTPCFSAKDIDADGRSTYKFRVELQYRDAEGLIESLVKREDFSDELRESGLRISEAYKSMFAFLTNQFPEPADLMKFLSFVLNKVKIIRIETPQISDALKIFETINERGVGLNSMDLLKNLLFRQIDRNDFEELKNIWKEMTAPLEKGGEKPLRFLRYFIMANYDVKNAKGEPIIREDEIYSWLIKNNDQCQYTERPFLFAQKLVESSKAYKTFLEGYQLDGNVEVALANLKRLMGSAGRQHLLLFLAAQHLSTSLFSHLARQVETLLFYYIISGTLSKEYEKKFSLWAKELLKVPKEGAAELNVFIETYIQKELDEKQKEFDRQFHDISMDRFQNYRIKYILAKITDYVEQQFLGNDFDRPLDSYFDSSIQIEHILPATPNSDLRESFGEDYDDYKQKLGNLTLLERPINIVASNGFFHEKKPLYRESSYHLTKSIVGSPDIGGNNSASRIYKLLKNFDKWDKESIDQRQAMLTSLAHEIWKLKPLV